MTEHAPEQRRSASRSRAGTQAQATSFDVSLVLVPTGRTHTVTGQGNVLIADEDGHPEHVYRLVANVDGEQVTLSEYGEGHVNGLVQSARTLRERQESEQS